MECLLCIIIHVITHALKNNFLYHPPTIGLPSSPIKILWTRKCSPRMKNSGVKCDSWIAHMLGLNLTNHAFVYEELVCNGLKENKIETVKLRTYSKYNTRSIQKKYTEMHTLYLQSHSFQS